MKSFGLGFIMVLSAFFVLAGFVAYSNLQTLENMKSAGIHTEAVIVKIQRSENRRVSMFHKEYTMTFIWTDQWGMRQRASTHVSPASAEQYLDKPEGRKITIKYLPDADLDPLIVGDEDWFLNREKHHIWVLPLIGFLGLAASWYGFFWSRRTQ